MDLRASDLYDILSAAYAPCGWWPVPSRAGRPGFDADGYHPGIHGEPSDDTGRFEILVGAILTQNTAWRNVEVALRALQAAGRLEPRRLAECGEAELAGIIRSAGYHNQKAKKLLIAARAGLDGGWWAMAADDGGMAAAPAVPTPAAVPAREELLALWGIGPETADSILLYAWGVPTFVIDAYTRRLLTRLGGWDAPKEGGAWPCAGRLTDLGFDPRTAGYERLRKWFMDGLAGGPAGDMEAMVVRYNECHATIVRHAKEHCRARPDCAGCPFNPPG